MIERREDLCFALEARHALGIQREGIGQDLDSDVATQSGVSGAIHLAHAAGTDSRHNLVRADTSAGEETHVQGRCALYGNEPQRLRPVSRSVRVQPFRPTLPAPATAQWRSPRAG